YRFEISQDVAFFNIIKDTLSPNTNINITLDDGQYFIRARAEKGTEFGDWSETVGFVVVTSVDCEHSPGDSDFIEDMLISNEFFIDEFIDTAILERTPNGTTDQEFYIVLNKNIDLTALSTPYDIDPEFGVEHPEVDENNEGLILIDNIIIHRRDF
ncbi:MAG: hypothetical protein ACRDB0_03245, partial [Paraclostridium sp.]